jgi:hypothetical protein
MARLGDNHPPEDPTSFPSGLSIAFGVFVLGGIAAIAASNPENLKATLKVGEEAVEGTIEGASDLGKFIFNFIF